MARESDEQEVVSAGLANKLISMRLIIAQKQQLHGESADRCTCVKPPTGPGSQSTMLLLLSSNSRMLKSGQTIRGCPAQALVPPSRS